MKTIIKLSTIILIVFTFASCGASSYTVSSTLDEPVYVRPARPYPNYVWIDGDWYWTGGRYTYHQGYWAAPRARVTWHRGAWEPRNNGYYWRRGRWHR